jgi:hypothetical protein
MSTSVGNAVSRTPAPSARSDEAVPVAPPVPEQAPPVPEQPPPPAAQSEAPDEQDASEPPGQPEGHEPSGREVGSEASEEPDDAAGDVPFEAADAVPRALQIVGSIVAPTTLVTGLFIYFGFVYAVAYFRYFGINYTLLELPNQAFLMLSANGVPVPLAVLAGAALLFLWLHQVPFGRASGRVRLLAWGLLVAVAVAGAGLLVLVVADAIFHRRLFPAGLWEARGLSLAIGVVLVPFAAHLWRALRGSGSREAARPGGTAAVIIARWFCLAVLFGVGLFWAVGSYAMRMGTQEAAGHVANLRCAPDAVLYSEKSLNLQYAGVWEEPAAAPDGAYGFRYPGLKLVPQPGKQYLLLPGDWAPGSRPAILLPRSDDLRLEFTTVAPPGSGAC